mgnify:CR=1 FL=1
MALFPQTSTLPQAPPRFASIAAHSAPNWVWGIVAVGCAVGLLSPHPFLSVASWLALPLLIRITLLEDEPPILFMGALVLWVKTVLPVIYFAGFRGLPLDRVSTTYDTFFTSTPQLDVAIWMSLVAVLVLALGARVAMQKTPPLDPERIRMEAHTFAPGNVFALYLLSYVANFIFDASFLLQLGGISQLAIAATFVKWSFFFLLVYVVLVQERRYGLLVTAITIEITFGLLGYWGSFRDFLFIFLAAYLFSKPTLSVKNILSSTSLVLVVLAVGLFWQTVKPEFREVITGGIRSQRTVMSYPQQAELLIDLAGRTSWSQMSSSVEAAVERFSVNVFFFGEVLEFVPQYRPYDGGAGWWRGIQHIIQPRLLFPNKPVLNDSEITNQYIMRRVSEEGASFSIGYFGESYADLGPYLMYVPIFLVGLGFGFIYNVFKRRAAVKIIGIGFCASFLIYRLVSIDDIPSLLGLTITQFLAMIVLLFLLERVLFNYLRR